MNLNLSEKLKTGLTPQEKIDCYDSAIEGIKVADYGICLELSLCFMHSKLCISYNDIGKLFPEFANLKPLAKEFEQYWFNSTKERIQVLNKLIEEQKKLL